MATEANAGDGNAELLRPRLSFETITFSDGSILALDQADIVVFVGPNNAGKSAALRELETWITNRISGLVIKSATTSKVGTLSDFRLYLDKTAQKSGNVASYSYGGIGYNIDHRFLDHFDRDKLGPVASFFTKRLATETRIQDSNAAPSLALFRDPPTHPIHVLLMDPDLSKDISGKFRHAFGKDLTPFRAGGAVSRSLSVKSQHRPLERTNYPRSLSKLSKVPTSCSNGRAMACGALPQSCCMY